MSEADDSTATLRRIEQSLADIDAKLDRLLALVARLPSWRLPSWWHMPVVIGATMLSVTALGVLAGWLGTSGAP